MGGAFAFALSTLAATALWALGIVAWPPWLAHLAWFVTGLYALWSCTLAAAKR